MNRQFTNKDIKQFLNTHKDIQPCSQITTTQRHQFSPLRLTKVENFGNGVGHSV